MTDEQILELAKSCGIEHWSRSKGECWECLEEQLLKFARLIHTEGFREGIDEGYDEGCVITRESLGLDNLDSIFSSNED